MSNKIEIANSTFGMIGVSTRSNAICTEESEFGDPKDLVESLINSISYSEFTNKIKNRIEFAFQSAIECGATPIEFVDLVRSSRQAYLFALKLPYDLPIPDISYDADFEVVMEWESRPKRWFSISIKPDGIANFASIIGASEMHGKFYAVEQIPEHIFSLIQKASRP